MSNVKVLVLIDRHAEGSSARLFLGSSDGKSSRNYPFNILRRVGGVAAVRVVAA